MKKEKSLRKELEVILNFNDDAKNYFFSKVPEEWINWLWNNGFLDILKNGSRNKEQYIYLTPEINYLTRVGRSKNKWIRSKVIEIINNDELATTKEKFNPELIDQILRLLSEWNAEDILQILLKIIKQNWIKSMSQSGGAINYFISKILNKLFNSKKYKEIIQFADIILTIKKQFNNENNSQDYDYYNNNESPFTLKDLPETQIFNYLAKIVEKGNIAYTEEIFNLLSTKYKKY